MPSRCPETVRRRVQKYVDLGFNHIIMQVATPGVSQRLRQEWLSRFAKEVAPDFLKAPAQRAAAA